VFGDKLFPGEGYPSPVSIPETTTCLVLQVPESAAWWALVVGLLYTLTLEWNWRQLDGGVDPADAAARWQKMLEDALDVAENTSSCPTFDVPTPYWDQDSEVDDSVDPASQVWYGTVDDPAEAPSDTTFIEDVSIWTFAGLLAVAGATPAALAFLTIAPKFVVAIRQGNYGKIVRLFVDGEEVAQITDAGDDSVLEIPVVADPEAYSHQVYITVGDS